MLKSTKYIALLPCLLLLSSPIALAAKNNTKARWFEIEVILFTQLGDKNQLKEQFPESSPLPRQRRVIELLKPFLKPDIRSLKSLISQCGQLKPQRSFFMQASKIAPFFQVKELHQIAAMPQTSSDITSFNEAAIEEASLANETIIAKTSTINESSAITSAEAQAIANVVAQAERAFNPFPFIYSQDHLSTKKLCRLPDKILTQLSKQDPKFDRYGFTVDKVPNVINAAENIFSDQPYLLNKDSLQLNNIVKQLRWSKNFKPLLHIGWRQAPKGRNRAIPVHIFAGDNLQADYQKRLAIYNKELKQAKSQELSLTRALSTNAPATLANKEPFSKQIAYQQAVQKRISSIIEQLQHFDKSNDEVIDEVITQLDNNELILKPSEFENIQAQQLTFNKPQPPLQDWFLDGYFKVNLNHYLYITADFNILNKTLIKQASDALKPDQNQVTKLKTIRFEQNRRVISKEIHYFDNPYLGMIVQIRRYKRPEPPVEDNALERIIN